MTASTLSVRPPSARPVPGTVRRAAFAGAAAALLAATTLHAGEAASTSSESWGVTTVTRR